MAVLGHDAADSDGRIRSLRHAEWDSNALTHGMRATDPIELTRRYEKRLT